MDRLHTGVVSGPWSIPRVAAFVRPVVGRSADPEGLALFCREHLAVHKTPRIWQTVEDFPPDRRWEDPDVRPPERYLASQGAPEAARTAGRALRT